MFLSVIFCTWYIVGCGSDFNTNPDIDSISKQESTMYAVPTDGSTPANYSANENAFISFTAMSKEKSFVGKSSGEAVTDVAFVSVSQKVKANRVVNGKEIYKESISHSSFKSVGVRTYVNGHNFVVREASNVDSVNSVSWKSKANRISEESFVAKYGHFSNTITSYVMTKDTILSSSYLGEKDGIYSFKYNLHPVKATGKISLEMRTMAGTKSMPIFESVSLTIRMDKNWRVTETLTDCVYEVDKLGGVTCRENVKEVFSGYGQNNAIPDADFFKGYLDSDITEPLPEELTASDYIMNGLSDYITGQKPLKVNLAVSSDIGLSVNATAQANVDVNDLSNLSVVANVSELSYDKLTFNDIYLAYENNSAFIRYGNLKATGTVDEITDLINRLLPLFGQNTIDLSSFTNFDTETLLSNASLVKEDDNVTVNLPITLGDSSLIATLFFTDGETVSFTGATATIENFFITLTPDDALVLPELGDGYNRIAPLFDIIDQNGNIKFNVSVGDINALVNFNVKNLSADIVLGDLLAKYVDDTIYLNYKDIKAKLSVSDIETALNKLAPVLEGKVSIPDFNALFESIDTMALLESAFGTLTITGGDTALTLSTIIENVKVDVVLNTINNSYVISGISAIVDNTTINAIPTNNDVLVIDDETLDEYKNILPLLDIIDQNNNLSFVISVNDLTIKATLNLVDLTVLAEVEDAKLFINLNTGDIFARYSGARVKVNINDLTYVLDQINPLIKKFANFDLIEKLPTDLNAEIDVDAIFQTITTLKTENGVSVMLPVFNIPITLNFDTTGGSFELENVTANFDGVSATATYTYDALDFEFDTGLDYVDLKELVDDFAQPVCDVILSDQMNVSLGGTLKNGNTVYSITACDIKIAGLDDAPKTTANLVLDITETSIGGTTTTTTHTISLVYLDPSLVSEGAVNVFFTYDSSLDNTDGTTNPIEGTFTTTKAGETLNILKDIYKQMPELQETLSPILVPDTNGYPVLPKTDIDLNALINALVLNNGTLTANLNGNAIMDSLPSTIEFTVNAENGAINLAIPELKVDGLDLSLALSLSKPQEDFADDNFSFTLDGNEKDFSSINELLEMLSKTAESRSFDITGNIGMSIGSWDIAKDAIDVRVQLDNIDDKTYVVITITRNPTTVLLTSVWKDYDGVSTIYLDPIENMIYTKKYSRTRTYKLFQGYVYSDTTEYKKFTVEQFTADLLPNLLYLLNLNSTIENLIPTDSSDSESHVSTATVENSLLGYSYNGIDTFNLKLDLEPLIGDIQEVNAVIKHDDSMNVSSLTATVLVVNTITINLDAKLVSPFNVYQNTKETLETEKNSNLYAI